MPDAPNKIGSNDKIVHLKTKIVNPQAKTKWL